MYFLMNLGCTFNNADMSIEKINQLENLLIDLNSQLLKVKSQIKDEIEKLLEIKQEEKNISYCFLLPRDILNLMFNFVPNIGLCNQCDQIHLSNKCIYCMKIFTEDQVEYTSNWMDENVPYITLLDDLKYNYKYAELYLHNVSSHIVPFSYNSNIGIWPLIRQMFCLVAKNSKTNILKDFAIVQPNDRIYKQSKIVLANEDDDNIYKFVEQFLILFKSNTFSVHFSQENAIEILEKPYISQLQYSHPIAGSRIYFLTTKKWYVDHSYILETRLCISASSLLST